MTEVRALIERLVEAGIDPIDAAEIITRAAIAGATAEPRSSAAIRQERYRRNKASQVVTRDAPPPKEAPPEPPEEITPSDPSTHKETPLRGSKKGSRLPSDFEPDIGFALSEGLSSSQADTEAAKFRDFWIAKPGAGGVKLDWPATWRNWVREAMRRGPQQRAGPSGRVTVLDLGKRLLGEMEAAGAGTNSEIGGNQQAPRRLSSG